jgi:glycosyltransferase involved in cell wall biosynthesis
VFVIPNAVPAAGVARPGTLRSSLGMSHDERVVFTAAGLEKNKGHDVLIAASAALPANVHLIIAGDGPERAALGALAARLGTAGRLHLLGHRDDVPALLGDADVFALATRADSTPNAALEAMAAAVPVVITAVPGSADLLAPASPEPLGWVVPIDDPAALTEALTAALGPEGPVRGARGQERVRRERTPERLGAQVESLLRGMFPEPTSPA